VTTQVFVARDRELTRLQSNLDRALAGQGQLVFVAGEAGSGKTALVREFARRAQDAHTDLVVAVGECDAQTGIGDPYLLFREILGQLTGDVDAKLAQGAITNENARRLRALLLASGQALVNLGPSLINFFIPGTYVLAAAGKFLANRAGWLKPLQQINERKPAADSMDQNRIFEQYTNVLQALATKKPLMVVVDDLQWSDAASISLLFHLGRRIAQSRILFVGAYRPDEVAMGRHAANSGPVERHPLEKVLAEFKRSAGDITLDLNQTETTESRDFVNALLDSEPNRLGKEFRQALLHHTGGHALFTVELLRTMQERGDLHLDEDGRWIVSDALDWVELPARAQGVIEERIGRLEAELRDELRVASVEGEDFAAQVIARVQATHERQLLRDLSEELGKRHRLVREQGETRVGQQILSRYQFAHALFQRYLYNSLSAGEKRLLHGEIAHVLEELYADCVETVTVQLAHHYTEAGENEKATQYLLAAGDQARRLYANAEATVHYRRALSLLPASENETAILLYEGLGDVLVLIGQFDQAHDAYQSALAHIAQEDAVCRARLERKDGNAWMPQRQMEKALPAYDRADAALAANRSETDPGWQNEWLEIQLDRAWALYWADNPSAMSALAEKIRPVVEQHGTTIQRCRFFRSLVLMAYRRDRYVISDETLEAARKSFAALAPSDDTGELVFARFIVGFTNLWRGNLDEAETYLLETLKLAEKIGDMERQVLSLTYLTITYRKQGQVEQVECYAEKSHRAASSAEMLFYIGMAQANRAWVEWRVANLAQTVENGRAALASWGRVTAPNQFKWTALFPLLAAALAQANIAEAIEQARGMLPPPQLRLPQALEATLQDAIKSWEANQSENADACLRQAVELAGQLGYL